MLVGSFPPKKSFTGKFHSLQNFVEGAIGGNPSHGEE